MASIGFHFLWLVVILSQLVGTQTGWIEKRSLPLSSSFHHFGILYDEHYRGKNLPSKHRTLQNNSHKCMNILFLLKWCTWSIKIFYWLPLLAWSMIGHIGLVHDWSFWPCP